MRSLCRNRNSFEVSIRVYNINFIDRNLLNEMKNRKLPSGVPSIDK